MSVITGDNNLRQFPARVEAKVGIVVSLDQLETWAKEYLADIGGNGSNDIEERLTLSSFICWIKQNKGATSGKV